MASNYKYLWKNSIYLDDLSWNTPYIYFKLNRLVCLCCTLDACSFGGLSASEFQIRATGHYMYIYI